MRMLDKVRTVADIVVITKAGSTYDRTTSVYEKAAEAIEAQVHRGLDPLEGEAALNATLGSLAPEKNEPTLDAEKAGAALVRLVERGMIDPLFAEDILDRGFQSSAIEDAIDDSKKVR